MDAWAKASEPRVVVHEGMRDWRELAIKTVTSCDRGVFFVYKATATQKPKRLMEQVRDKFRKLHYSYRTEQAYCDWIKRYIWFHNKRHPREMGAAEVEAFLSHLATDRGVSASTQNQALCALLFLYRKVLEELR